MNTRNIRTAVLLAFLAFATRAVADESRLTFDFDASAGYSHDSNVGIEDLDASTGEADNAVQLDAGLRGTFGLLNGLSVSAGYELNDTAYATFSEFDLTLHRLFGELNYQASAVDAGITAEQFRAVLGGNDYLTLTQVTPNMSRLFGDHFYLRLGYTIATKDYDVLSDRNADNNSLRADAYILIDNLNQYISIGARSETEDASNPELDYTGIRWSIAYGHRLAFWNQAVDLKLQLQYEDRDYLNVTEEIDARRFDERLQSSLTATYELSQHFSVEADIRHTNNTSNLASAELDKWVYGLGLSATF